MRDREMLFYSKGVHDFFDEHKTSARQLVEQLNAGQMSASSDEQIVEYVMDQVRLEPLVLHEEQKTAGHRESKIDMSHDFRYGGSRAERVLVPSLAVKVSMPYTGDPPLWHVTPNPHTMSYPRAVVHQRDAQGVGHIVIMIERPTDADPAEFSRALAGQVDLIQGCLKGQLKNVEDHNDAMIGVVREAVQRRRTQLDRVAAVQKMLDIPMKPRPGAPTFEPIAAPRKIVRPLPSALPARPEWGLSDGIYEHVLKVIRHEGRSFESTPATFQKLDEEELRDVILAHLNGHYEGEASGERFRKHGKTDICIEVENRAAFVGECKVWHGAKDCAAAADQLLSYVTWRDSKCALVFFNKTVKGFTDVQASAVESLRGHPLFDSDAGGAPPGEWRFRFRQKDDEKRIVTVHVFLFNLVLTPRGKV